MSSTRFDKWMRWWYTELRKRTTGNIILIMDNCGGHEIFFDYPALRFDFLLPKSTHKYQTLELGLIAHGKIRNRTLLLSQVDKNVL